MGFAESFKEIRKKLGFSQQELASRLKVAQSTIGMWESAQRTPKLDEINRIAKVLKVTVPRLIGQKQAEIIKDVIVINGKKIDITGLDAADIDDIAEYIGRVKSRKVGPA